MPFIYQHRCSRQQKYTGFQKKLIICLARLKRSSRVDEEEGRRRQEKEEKVQEAGGRGQEQEGGVGYPGRGQMAERSLRSQYKHSPKSGWI